MSEATCETCRYYVAVHYNEMHPKAGQRAWGECRKNPPTRTDPEVLETLWPDRLPDDWCGEYEAWDE